MSQVIETRATLGADFIKGLAPKLYDVKNQADDAYSLAMPSALGVEANNYTALWKDAKTDQAQETIATKTGISKLELTGEGEDYKSASRSAGYRVQFRPVKYTQSITITEEDRADRLVNSKLDEAKDLMIAAKRTMNRHAFDLFNYAFTPQANLPAYLTFYADGVPMCSTLHPIKVAGGTQSNASTTGIPLTEINLEIAKTALRRQVDDNGDPQGYGSGKLILLVPDSLEKQAVIITDSEMRSNTANNDMNVYDGNVTVISSLWLNAQNGGSDTQWFLIDAMKSPAMFMTREGVSLRAPYITDSNQNVTIPIMSRHQVGNVDFRGVWGSKGDNLAYAL
jgi:hypothetical protein